jgi:SsrA-binding protein
VKKLPSHILADNRAAKFHYEILAEFEAGIILTGKEVKSLRTNSLKLAGSFIRIRHNEAWLIGLKIPPYKYAKDQPHEEVRNRKLLLQKKEIDKIQKNLKTKGIACVPLNIHLANSKIKIKIALGRGKKRWDKREIVKQRDLDREARRGFKI